MWLQFEISVSPMSDSVNHFRRDTLFYSKQVRNYKKNVFWISLIVNQKQVNSISWSILRSACSGYFIFEFSELIAYKYIMWLCFKYSCLECENILFVPKILSIKLFDVYYTQWWPLWFISSFSVTPCFLIHHRQDICLM